MANRWHSRRWLGAGCLRLTLAAMLVTMLAACSNQDRADPKAAPADGWHRLQGGPLSGRTGALVVGLDNSAYVIGGSDFLCPPGADCSGPETVYSDGAVVDLKTENWREIADAPVPIQTATASVIRREIFVLAYDPGRVNRPLFLSYHVDRDSWTNHGRAPRGVWHLTRWNGLLVGSTDSDEGGEKPDQVFDPDRGEWTAIPDDPLPKSYDRFVVPDGERLLVLGSPLSPNDSPKAVAAWSARSKTWTRLPDAPQDGYQVWDAGDRIFLNGHFGPDQGGILDLDTDTWSKAPSGPRVEGKAPKSWLGDAAGLIRPASATYEYASGWVLDACRDPWTWRQVRDPDPTSEDESVGVVGNRLIIAGGQRWPDPGNGTLVADVWVWTPPAAGH